MAKTRNRTRTPSGPPKPTKAVNQPPAGSPPDNWREEVDECQKLVRLIREDLVTDLVESSGWSLPLQGLAAMQISRACEIEYRLRCLLEDAAD